MRILSEIGAGDTPAIVSPSGVTYGRAELARRCAGVASVLRDAVGDGCLLIRLADPFALAVTLLAADGVLRKMLVLPADLPAEVASQLAAKAGAGFEVTDRTPIHGLVQVTTSGAEVGSTGHGLSVGGSPMETLWVLATSGTTRTPKLIAHTAESLTRTVKRDAVRGAGLRWGMFYDIARFAGLQVLFQALLGGGCVLLADTKLPVESRVVLFARSGCNAISATPTHWRKILMTPDSGLLHLEIVTLGGEIADATVLAALRAAYPRARLTHVYASTEAGVGFSVRDGFAGFPVGWLREGVGGCSLRINAEGILEIAVPGRAAHVFSESEMGVTEDGYVVTGDLVRCEGERVIFLGRDSGAINVGGNKVQPEEVEHVLLAHPAVAMVKVFAQSSAITGTLVAAQVVFRDGQSASVADLRTWCYAHLERHKVPALLKIVTELGVASSGKLTR